MNPFRPLAVATLASLALVSCAERPTVTAPSDLQPLASSTSATTGVNVLLKGPITDAIVADLGTIGPVLDKFSQINAVTMRATAAEIPAILAKPYVADAELDAETDRIPTDPIEVPTDFGAGMSTWDQDAIGVTVSPGFTGRNEALGGLTGKGVYVVILDTGLLPTWPEYFPTDRIATQYARAFGGGGGLMGTISEQPDKWQGDTDSHGTHVTSTVIGYRYATGDVNGTAPMATIIPVKVLNQNGSAWTSVITHGILYAAELKAGPLAGSPVVVNMSLSGGRSALQERAIDYAISRGVLIVAAAGNGGARGMGWPGAYAPVISVAAYGWTRQWLDCATGQPMIRTWWRTCDVAEPTRQADFFIAGFSARELTDGRFPQQLDVAAPGVAVVGAYQTAQGLINWFFLNGTSMASPHVAGIVAMMAEKKPTLTQAEAEAALKSTALRLSAGSRTVFDPNTERNVTVSWGSNATGRGMVDAVAAIKAVRSR